MLDDDPDAVLCVLALSAAVLELTELALAVLCEEALAVLCEDADLELELELADTELPEYEEDEDTELETPASGSTIALSDCKPITSVLPLLAHFAQIACRLNSGE